MLTFWTLTSSSRLLVNSQKTHEFQHSYSTSRTIKKSARKHQPSLNASARPSLHTPHPPTGLLQKRHPTLAPLPARVSSHARMEGLHSSYGRRPAVPPYSGTPFVSHCGQGWARARSGSGPAGPQTRALNFFADPDPDPKGLKKLDPDPDPQGLEGLEGLEGPGLIIYFAKFLALLISIII